MAVGLGQGVAAALVVDDALFVQVLGRGDVEFAIEDGVACGVFVHVGGAVANPLAGHKDGQFDVEFDLTHLKRGGVPVAHKVADQAFVVLHGFGAFAIADAGGLCDGGVVAHVINDAHEAVVEHLVRGIEVLFHAGCHHAAGGGGLCTLVVDVGLLLRRNRHGEIPLGDSQVTISGSVAWWNSHMQAKCDDRRVNAAWLPWRGSAASVRGQVSGRHMCDC